MVFRKSPAYLWQHPSGQWYFKRPIPPHLRDHFAPNAKGKRPTHIIASLETHSRVEAEQRKRPHAMAAEATFGKLLGKGSSTALERAHAKLADVRESWVHLQANGQDDDWAATSALEDMARDAAEVIHVRKAKTRAGVRSIPVTHPAAVALLKRRAEAQADRAGWLFSECVPGGPDMKQRWHMQKALGRDRRRLGLDPTAKFHSARASFATRMEEKGVNSNHVKRYVGHVLESVLDRHYVGKLKPEAFLPLADAARYSGHLEAAIAFAVDGAGAR